MALDTGWDIFLTSAGGVALTEGALATAQNVANECRLFTRDAYFRQNSGIPHFLLILGVKPPSRTVFKTHLRRAAHRVPDTASVDAIEVEDFDPAARRLYGNIFLTTLEGENVSVSL
jgi:hypothetical protein